jgi:hypothetical protein
MDETLTRNTLQHGLRTWASGSYGTEAAVELLIAHRRWLDRPTFHQACWIDDGIVGIDWDTLAARSHLEPTSSSERRILELAVGLAGQLIPNPSSLGDLVSGLDDDNISRVMNAIWHAAGRHDRHQTITLTGRTTR